MERSTRKPINRGRGQSRYRQATALIVVALVFILAVFVFLKSDIAGGKEPGAEDIPLQTDTVGGESSDLPEAGEAPNYTDAGEAPAAGQEPEALYAFEPYAVDVTLPQNMLTGTGIVAGGSTVESYTFPESIDFGFGRDYSALEGIITFRGNNFRDTASYGYANIVNAKLETVWSRDTASLTAPGDGAYWSGHGWTGQPLIVKWPKETRAVMNMYDWAKEQDELIEVIYAGMGGYVYFNELETGKETRDKLYLGYVFKGSGALDPRGYPLLYIGAGYNSPAGTARAMIVSLIDCTVLYEFGSNDSYSLRGSLSFFDSSPLVDAETDRLIYPGENGILYIIKLNSHFDPAAGTMTIDPSDTVKWRYNGKRSGSGQFWHGMETSAAIWRGHLIIGDNGGHLMCLKLDTLETVWVQDTLDDTNGSPVLELEDGHPYVYMSTSFHGGWRAPTSGTATIPLWKIDAVTGERIWQVDYKCYTVDGVSGGVEATAAVGKHGLSELVYFAVARTPAASEGVLVAINKTTGEVVWENKTLMYAWSSPVCVYDESGKGYVIYCTAGGYMYLYDGLTGEQMDAIDLGSTIEASPAVYEDTIVIGTRGMKIWGINIS